MELEALKDIVTINQIAQEEGVLPGLFESVAKHRHDDEKAECERERLERSNASRWIVAVGFHPMVKAGKRP